MIDDEFWSMDWPWLTLDAGVDDKSDMVMQKKNPWSPCVETMGTVRTEASGRQRTPSDLSGLLQWTLTALTALSCRPHNTLDLSSLVTVLEISKISVGTANGWKWSGWRMTQAFWIQIHQICIFERFLQVKALVKLGLLSRKYIEDHTLPIKSIKDLVLLLLTFGDCGTFQWFKFTYVEGKLQPWIYPEPTVNLLAKDHQKL